MPHLQPIIPLHPKLLLPLVRLTNLLPMRQRPHQLTRVPIVLERADAVYDTVPAGGLLGFILPDLVEADVWACAGCVHGEVETDFPFEEADFVLGAEPGLFQEGWEED